MILCTLVTDSEVANGKDARGLYEMQLGAWVVVQLQGIVANQGQKKTFLLPICGLLIHIMSGVLASWLDEQFFLSKYPDLTSES